MSETVHGQDFLLLNNIGNMRPRPKLVHLETICMTANTVVNQSVFHFFKYILPLAMNTIFTMHDILSYDGRIEAT